MWRYLIAIRWYSLDTWRYPLRFANTGHLLHGYIAMIPNITLTPVPKLKKLWIKTEDTDWTSDAAKVWFWNSFRCPLSCDVCFGKMVNFPPTLPFFGKPGGSQTPEKWSRGFVPRRGPFLQSDEATTRAKGNCNGLSENCSFRSRTHPHRIIALIFVRASKYPWVVIVIRQLHLLTFCAYSFGELRNFSKNNGAKETAQNKLPFDQEREDYWKTSIKALIMRKNPKLCFFVNDKWRICV